MKARKTIELHYYKEDNPAMCGFKTTYDNPRTLYYKIKGMPLTIDNIVFLWLNGRQQSKEEIKTLIDWIEECRKEEINERN